jgi:hypothetical protein
VFALGLFLSIAIGLSLGLLGGGGSILAVPVIHYVFHAEPHAAIAMSLVVVGVTSTAALIPQIRAGHVQWKAGAAFGAASMAGAFAGGRIGAQLPAPVLIPAFALVMLAAGIAMLVRSRTAPTPRPAGAIIGAIDVPRVLAMGLGVGLVTGTLGAGGGFAIVPALTLGGGLAMHEAVGTSLLVITMNSFAGLAGAASHAHGSLDGGIVAAVTCAAVAGSIAGARLGRRLSAHHLQQTFGWFVIAVGVFILVRELG